MTPRILLGLAAVVGLAACQPIPEDSKFGTSVNQSFDAQKAQRDAALAASVPAPEPVSAQALPAAGSAEATAAETAAILAATGTQAAAPVIASPANPSPAVVNASGISQENNFEAVSGQRSIELDAEKIAANRAQYRVIQPEALPKRESGGPNIVAYALATSHPIGTAVHKRVGFNKARKFQRNCGTVTHQDRAQIDFLAAGGPKKDPKGMDPDGDGYACSWNPAVYRTASSEASE